MVFMDAFGPLKVAEGDREAQVNHAPGFTAWADCLDKYVSLYRMSRGGLVKRDFDHSERYWREGWTCDRDRRPFHRC